VKVLLAQDLLYVPALRAANRANRGLLEALASRGHDCRAVVPVCGWPECATRTQAFGEWAARGLGVAWASPDAEVYSMEGVEVHAVQDPARLASYLREQVGELQPDLTLVTAEDPDLELLAAAADALPAKLVALLHSASARSARGRAALGRADGLAAPGARLRDELQRWAGRGVEAFRFPAYGYAARPFPRPPEHGAVTIINPAAAGLALLGDLARRLPDLAFTAALGWKSGEEERAAVAALPNVRLLELSDDLGEMLAGTRVLLVPAVESEGTDPFAVEAMLRGIPVLASDLADLADLAAGSDLLAAVPGAAELDVAAWEQAVRRLVVDGDLHVRVATAAREAATAFAAQALDLSSFEAWCLALPASSRTAAASAPHHAAPGVPGVPMPAPRAPRSSPSAPWQGRDTAAGGGLQFSLFFFSADGSTADPTKYRMLLESARFGDRHGFTAVWTPERHFNAFGGLYPNPAVTSSALAVLTERIQLRAGSVVLPLQNPLRVAEEWAVVDNLSGGRVALSFASGWHVNDFVIAPAAFERRREIVFEGVETVRRLWRGESIALPNGLGNLVEVQVYPKPLHPDLSIWITCQSDPTFVKAGEMGANVLTNLNQKNPEDLRNKVRLYRDARSRSGHDPDRGVVTLMLHTFVTADIERTRARLKAAYGGYLLTNMGLQMRQVEGIGADVVLAAADRELIMEAAFERLLDTHGLVGTPAACVAKARRFAAAGVDEIACLIDFGLDLDEVLRGLELLAEVKDACAAAPREVER
jgi:natural product biosynthesis luciferase-like monooxygenase protein